VIPTYDEKLATAQQESQFTVSLKQIVVHLTIPNKGIKIKESLTSIQAGITHELQTGNQAVFAACAEGRLGWAEIIQAHESGGIFGCLPLIEPRMPSTCLSSI